MFDRISDRLLGNFEKLHGRAGGQGRQVLWHRKAATDLEVFSEVRAQLAHQTRQILTLLAIEAKAMCQIVGMSDYLSDQTLDFMSVICLGQAFLGQPGL